MVTHPHPFPAIQSPCCTYMGVPVRRNMCVSIPTIGCLDMTARPEPNAPLSLDIYTYVKKNLPCGYAFAQTRRIYRQSCDSTQISWSATTSYDVDARRSAIAQRRSGRCFEKKRSPLGSESACVPAIQGQHAQLRHAGKVVRVEVPELAKRSGCRRLIVLCDSWTLPCCSKTTRGCKHTRY